eukprot:TRINITY_DN66382_c0_g2_i1.p1 TRINITY_DN66382_c0_g2~~TRINITY_DN66382_c0_g2_i1.p1  ORF type:complete len:532 (+),score=63.69 TRINITY_DN66382_c0_g2_i1:69-1664(+)
MNQQEEVDSSDQVLLISMAGEEEEETEMSNSGVADETIELQEHHQQTMASTTAAPVASGDNGTPTVEMKLFVGRVPHSFDEAQLKPIFEEFGEVADCAVIRDRESQTHRGCAFVRMLSLTKADEAVRVLNNQKSLEPAMGPMTVKYATGEHERLGLPTDCSCLPGVDQVKLFVGSLPKQYTEDDVKITFSPFGQVDEVFIMKNEAKESKGCAFVKMAFKEQALHAINGLNQKPPIGGHNKPLEVRFAETKKIMPTGSVSVASPAMSVASTPYRPDVMGSGGVPSPAVPQVPVQKGNWTEYLTNEGRPYYYNSITQKSQWERPIEIDRPPPAMYMGMSPLSPAANQSYGPPGANVFVFHIPNEWIENDLHQTFSPYGTIISARIAVDKTTGRHRGFGFVSYDNAQSAVNACAAMNQFQVGGGKRLKVQIKKGEEAYVQGVVATVMPHATALAMHGSGGHMVMGNPSMQHHLAGMGVNQTGLMMGSSPDPNLVVTHPGAYQTTTAGGHNASLRQQYQLYAYGAYGVSHGSPLK